MQRNCEINKQDRRLEPRKIKGDSAESTAHCLYNVRLYGFRIARSPRGRRRALSWLDVFEREKDETRQKVILWKRNDCGRMFCRRTNRTGILYTYVGTYICPNLFLSNSTSNPCTGIIINPTRVRVFFSTFWTIIFFNLNIYS